MSLKKQFAVTLASVGLGAALIGGGTFAYFNDVVESENNTFASGTIDLTPDNPNKTALFNVQNAQPGDTFSADYTLTNAGSLDANLTAKFEYTPEGNGDNSDLGYVMHITSLTYNGTDILNQVTDADADGVITVGELNGTAFDLGQINSNGGTGTFDVGVTFHDSGQPQNEYQGDSINGKFTFEARQID